MRCTVLEKLLWIFYFSIKNRVFHSTKSIKVTKQLEKRYDTKKATSENFHRMLK